MKKAFKIFWTVIVVLAIMLFTVWMLLQLPGVQTFVAKKVVTSLEKKIDGKIEFSRVYLRPFNAIVLKDFVLLDNSPVPSSTGEVLDTVATAGSVVTTFSLKGLFKKEGIHLNRINVSDASFSLVIEPSGTNITRVFGGKKEKEDKEGRKEMGHIFDAKKVNVDNFRFRMKNIRRERPPKEYGIDWWDMDLTVNSLSGKDLSLAHGYMKGVVDDLSASEKSGYTISSLSGKTMVGHGKTVIQDVRLIDPWSDIHLDEYTMSYDSTESFAEYMDEVTMTGSLRDSKVAFKSLSYFVPALKDRDICLLVGKGDIEGTVTDLGISRFDFKEQGSGVSGSLEGRITGLPEIGETVLDFGAENLRFTSEGLGKFIKGFAPTAKMDLSKFAPGEEVNFDGRLKGRLNNLELSGKAGTESMGEIEADIRMNDLVAKGSASRFSGHVSTQNLDLGKILGMDKLGEVTMRGILDATLGDGKTNLKIDTLFIDKLHLLDYDYSNIMAVGTYSDKAFDGRLVSHDPNLNLLFQGIFTFSDKTSNGLYKFYANVGYADLQALGLDKRGVSKVSGRVNANYMTIGSGDVIGDLDILDLNLENSQGLHDIGNIRIASHSNNDVHRINLNSSFADGSYIGSKPVTSILGDLMELTVQRELPVLCKEITERWKGDTHDLKLDFHDSRDILSFLMPGLYIADSTKIRLSVKADGEVKGSVKSSRIAMAKNYLRNLDLALDNKDGSLNGVVTGSELRIAGLLLRNDNITLYANDDHVGIGCVYDNEADLTDKGELFLSGEFERDEDGMLLIHGKTLPSSIWFNDEQWVITPTVIEMVGKDLKVDNLTASSGEQYLKLDGGFSSTTGDTLRIDLSKLNMALANRFVGEDFGISGRATGHAMVTSPWKDNAGLIMSILCDSVMVAGKAVGQLRLGSSLDEAGKVHLIARNDLGGRNTLDLRGDYFTKDKSIDMLVGLDEMEVGYLAPLLTSVFSEMAGQVSGKVRLKGKTDALSLSGEDTRLDDVLLRVAYTGVPYFASGPVQISDNGIVFDGISVKDRYDGTGTMAGGILFDHLKDIRMDTRIRMSRMEAIDMDERSGQAFYGNVFASGNVSIRGPFNAIKLDINARTDKNGTLHI
ncbi:MAG: hypothetical protein IK076_02960, partial [Bacteroidales bacterium]|nr:hypothetical protein [Bacteroidales bacterium]